MLPDYLKGTGSGSEVCRAAQVIALSVATDPWQPEVLFFAGHIYLDKAFDTVPCDIPSHPNWREMDLRVDCLVDKGLA